ncbi:hypothetical protein KFK09_015455 [Dendrobium nobile]|uniref:Uncharacterized protein n=1 Tax=Dendrobium nobile TaxID=94219 RepID=A0A8T3B7A5_DENNO|nr:hypothetical protein KFK09_015455 [Dendrobium nobile]
MTKPTIAIGVLAITLALSLLLLLLLLLHLSFSLLRRRTHPPCPPETPSLSPANFSPAKLSPFYAHGVLRAPKRFLLSSPKLDAMLHPSSPPSADAAESFVCISNPVFDLASGRSKAVVEYYGDRSPELKLMKKLPLKAVLPAPMGGKVDTRPSLATVVSAMEKNIASFSSEKLCSSPACGSPEARHSYLRERGERR